MKVIKQKDPRWADMTIGNSHSTLGAQGCLICSLLMLWQKFHPFNNPLLPSMVNKKWKFNNNLLDWSTNFQGMEFVERVWTYHPDQDKEIKKLCNSKDYGVALQVQTRTGGVHWVACWNKSIFGWATLDPWTGRTLWKTVGFGAPYLRVLGWVKFKLKDL